MGSGRTSRRRKAASGRTIAAVGGLSLVGAAAVALTFGGPKAPPEYRSRAEVAPAADTVAARAPSGSAAVGGAAAGRPPVADAAVSDTATRAAVSGADVAVVLGDGLSATPSRATSFACAAVVRQGWECRNFAAAGSGYVSDGKNGDYLDQLTAARRTDDVGLVLVSGGGVDRLAAEGAVNGSAQRLVARAAFTFPGATIVLVSPFDTGAGTGPGGAGARQALRSAADGRDVVFVDASAWFREVPAPLARDGRTLTPKASSVAVQRLSAVIPAVLGTA